MRALKLAVALLFAAVSWCQTGPGDDPHSINGYVSNPQGYYIYPGNNVIYTYCAYLENPANPNDRVYVKDVNVQVVMNPWKGTGWHGHEIAGTQRPYAVVRSANPAKTGSDGCVNFNIQVPWFSGWYTIEATSTFGRTGVNEYLKYWAGNRLSPTYLQGYQDDPPVNRPQSYHVDTHHAGTPPGTSVSRWFLPSVINQIATASEKYSQDTYNLTSYPDAIDITRGSLPDGGRADNEGPGFTPDGATVYPNWVEWSVRSGETHSLGSEVDIVNPVWVFDSTHMVMVRQAMNANNCTLGALDSNLARYSGDSTIYWGGKDIMHFVCKPNALLKY